MATKNIYIREDDLGLIEWAEANNLNLSGLFAECLKKQKQVADRQDELRKSKFETIRADLFNDDTGAWKSKQFEGRWIVAEFRTDDARFDDGFVWEAAFTKGGRIVVVSGPEGTPSNFVIYDSFDEVSDSELPEDFKSAIAAEIDEDYVEVLDI